MSSSRKRVLVYLRVATKSQTQDALQKKREKKLFDYRLRQLAGEHLPCPRCGNDAMDTETVMHNAYSRHVDIYVCNQCGLEEALIDFVGAKPDINDWSLFREN